MNAGRTVVYSSLSDAIAMGRHGEALRAAPAVISPDPIESVSVLGTPTASLIQGVYTYALAAPETVTRTVYAHIISATRFTKTETPRSINNKIDEVLNDPEMYDDGERRPDENVIRAVKDLIAKTKAQLGGRRFPEVTVRPLDGTLRLTWTSESGNVRLVYSRNKNDRYIYHEKVGGGKAIDPGLVHDVSSSSLATWLKWLISR